MRPRGLPFKKTRLPFWDLRNVRLPDRRWRSLQWDLPSPHSLCSCELRLHFDCLIVCRAEDAMNALGASPAGLRTTTLPYATNVRRGTIFFALTSAPTVYLVLKWKLMSSQSWELARPILSIRHNIVQLFDDYSAKFTVEVMSHPEVIKFIHLSSAA